MTILDELVNYDYDEDDIKELKGEIDKAAILAVYAIEKMWELLKNSNLPDDVKIKILTNNIENTKKEN